MAEFAHVLLADVLDVAWSSDGAFLASCSVDNTVRVWDAATGREAQLVAYVDLRESRSVDGPPSSHTLLTPG